MKDGIYQHRYSNVCLVRVDNEDSEGGEDWFVICGDGEENLPYSKKSARLIAKHAVLTEVALLRNKVNALQDWADALSTDDFEEYYKEYIQE